MNDIKTFKRTDYTGYLRARTHIDTLSHGTSNVSAESELMTISIRIKLPDYSKWDIYGFVRQYPYMTLAGAAIAIISLILAGDILSWLWHLTHNHGVHK